MAYWIDPVLLFWSGFVEARILADRGDDRPLAVTALATLLVTYVVAVGLLANDRRLEPLWRRFAADSGTEFMYNGGILGVVTAGTEWQDLPPHLKGTGIALLCCYPLFLLAGVRAGRP